MNVEKGLLRETEEVQEQIWALLRCDVRQSESSSDLINSTNGRRAGSPLSCPAVVVRRVSKANENWNDNIDLKQFLNQEPENEITLTAFRLLTIDLIALYYVMNEGTMNVLGT